jgi:hypothetical protein
MIARGQSRFANLVFAALYIALILNSSSSFKFVALRSAHKSSISTSLQSDHETKITSTIDLWMNKALKIKCPFFRRRASDLVDGVSSLLQFMQATNNTVNYDSKLTYTSLETLADMILQDWTGRTSGKGYYITGRLSSIIYKDQCLFDGPDPDMPVKGLKKYLSSASQLFEYRSSRADLLRPLVIDRDRNTITAYWRLEGVLNLPWHPHIKPWTGSTTYIIDPEYNLIEGHIETWDISVMDAFISTLFPQLNYGSKPAPPTSNLAAVNQGFRVVSSTSSAPASASSNYTGWL